jgi:hypothetical protein
MQVESELWLQPGDGTALFASPELFRYYRLPLSFHEQVVVGSRFQVAQLLPMLEADSRYYLLATSQNAVRLLHGSHQHVTELHPDTLPHDLRSALNIDEFKRSFQQHSAGTALSADYSHGQGNRGGAADNLKAVFHGQGGSGLEVKKRDELLQFFHRIDRELEKFLQSDRTPLVFAGVDYLFPIFRETCRYAGLVDIPVEGSPDHLSPQQLHEKAREVLQPLFERNREEALRKYGDGIPRDQATADLQDLITAARRGQIDTLFLGEGKSVWGQVDEASNRIELHSEPNSGAEDLLNNAALWTILGNGQVFTLPLDRMPDRQPAAALLRWKRTE